MNSSKREKTPWTKFRKKHGPKKKENGEYLFDESRRKELENKAYPSEFMAATTRKTVTFEEQITSKDKYLRKFWR